MHPITRFRIGNKFSGEKPKYIKTPVNFNYKNSFLDKLIINETFIFALLKVAINNK
jgi:hypothetical protein